MNQNSYEELVAKRNKSAARFKQGQSTLLILAVVTLINTVLLITQSDMYLLFCAIMPYYAVQLAMLFCGKYPPEVYEGWGEDILANPAGNGLFIGAIIFAILVIAALALCGYLSMKKKWAYITGFVIAMVDTVVFLGLIGMGMLDPVESLLDILFRVWIVVELVIGLKNMIIYNNLKDIQPPVTDEFTQSEIPGDSYTSAEGSAE